MIAAVATSGVFLAVTGHGIYSLVALLSGRSPTLFAGWDNIGALSSFGAMPSSVIWLLISRLFSADAFYTMVSTL